MDRKELILNTIVKEHISSGNPVSSGILVDKYDLGVSPATVRNEMANLEELGFIEQPHTSAGRIPTEKAYVLFLENLNVKNLAKKELDSIAENLEVLSEMNFKKTAKEVAQISGLAVFWAFHKYSLYYTGISNLLQQPEFSQSDAMYDISKIIDHMDEIIGDIFDDVEEDGEQILIGSGNPFSENCSTVMFKYRFGDNIGLVGILGPMRMDYEKNLSIIKSIKEKLK